MVAFYRFLIIIFCVVGCFPVLKTQSSTLRANRRSRLHLGGRRRSRHCHEGEDHGEREDEGDDAFRFFSFHETSSLFIINKIMVVVNKNFY